MVKSRNVQNETDRASSVLSNVVWRRHVPTLRKLLRLRLCKTRKQIREVNVDPDSLRLLLGVQQVTVQGSILV